MQVNDCCTGGQMKSGGTSVMVFIPELVAAIDNSPKYLRQSPDVPRSNKAETLEQDESVRMAGGLHLEYPPPNHTDRSVSGPEVDNDG